MGLLVRVEVVRFVSTLRSIVLFAPMVIGSCQSNSASDITQAERDCAGGNRGACQMLDAIDDPNSAGVIARLAKIRNDTDAIQNGMDHARSTPRPSYPMAPGMTD